MTKQQHFIDGDTGKVRLSNPIRAPQLIRHRTQIGSRAVYPWGFSGGSDSKESACNEGDLDSIPGLGTSPGGGHGNPLIFLPGESPRTEEPGKYGLWVTKSRT